MQLSIASVPLILPKYSRYTPACEAASFELSFCSTRDFVHMGEEAYQTVLAAVPYSDVKVQYIKFWVLGAAPLTPVP